MRDLVLYCILLAALSGCASKTDRCLMMGGRWEAVATFLFGLEIPGRGPVRDSEWASFLHDVVTPRFPDGMTVVEGHGQWRDPAAGLIVRERSRVLIVASEDTPALNGNLSAVADAYKREFHQKSVGILVSPACVVF